MKYWLILLLVMSTGTSQEERYIDSTRIRNPKIAWKLGLIPGLGQLYNAKYLKAIGFVAGEYVAVTRFNQFKKENSIGLRNTYAWWIFGIYLWSVFDAYVDAQLSTFPVKRLEYQNELDSLKIIAK